MNRMLLPLLLLLGMAPGTHAAPEEEPGDILPMYLSAGELLNNCAASSLTSLGRERRRFCTGFVSGVEESMRLARQRGNDTGVDAVCPPPEVSARQLAETYVRYAGQNRQHLVRPAAELVAQSLRDAYPCKRANPE